MGECSGNGRNLSPREIQKEWSLGVTETTFGNELQRLIDEEISTGEIQLRGSAERNKIARGACLFFKEFSSRIVELSDGRCVCFAPDPRSRLRGVSNDRAWAEYAIHAVTNGGALLSGKGYHMRWYNHRKVENFEMIVPALKYERCVPGIKKNPYADTIEFWGESRDGGRLVVVVRLDEYGKASADMTEGTVEAGKSLNKKSPQLKPLAEAVEAVVRHQAAGTNPSTDEGIIAQTGVEVKGGWGCGRLFMI